MTHILAATDLSPRADRAVERAFQLAAAHGAALTVLTVLDDAMPERLAKVMMPETRGHLTAFCDSLSDGGRIGYEAKVLQGDPSHLIPETARVLQADLIALGLHRRRPFMDTLRETTLERTVRLAAAPVLLVRNHPEGDYARILAAVDFSPASAAAIRVAHRLAPGATIRGVHAVQIPLVSYSPNDPRSEAAAGFVRDAEDASARWMDLTALPPTLTKPEIRAGALSTVLGSELAALRPDLLALGAHARLGIAHRMLGSFALELVRDPPTDLLIATPGTD
ncbi:universal stress protein [Palleronia sp. KMU-117]|uniref:universal stress protein n=1 Tax=Palleronia sp. KMU-117 TaxID=3434108 RepID=UPI003D739715